MGKGCSALPALFTVCLVQFRFSAAEVPTSVFGDKLRQQVEERLAFYETGEPPRKNLDVMKEAVVEVRAGEGRVCRLLSLELMRRPEPDPFHKWRQKLI